MFSLPPQRRAPALLADKTAPNGSPTLYIEPFAKPPRRRFAPAIMVSVLAHVVGIIALATITFRSATPRLVQPSLKSSVPLAGVVVPDEPVGKPDAGGGSGVETAGTTTQAVPTAQLAAMGPAITVEGADLRLFPRLRDEFFAQFRAGAEAPGTISFTRAGWGGGIGNGTGDGNNEGVQGSGNGHAGYLHCPRPDYPRLARQQGWQGTTLLRVEVRVDGAPGTVQVAESSGYEVLDNAALKAVHSWKFQPGHSGDQSVACWVEVPVRFALR